MHGGRDAHDKLELPARRPERRKTKPKSRARTVLERPPTLGWHTTDAHEVELRC